MNKTPLFELEYDELWRSSGSKLPVLVRANRDECAVSENGSGFIIRKKSELPGGRYCGNVDESDFEGRNVSVECELDYSAAVRNIKLERPSNRIEPHYLKKPNIT